MEQQNSNFNNFAIGLVTYSQEREVIFDVEGFDQWLETIKQRAEESQLDQQNIQQIEQGLQELQKVAEQFDYREFEEEMENSNIDGVYKDLEDFIELRKDKLLQQFYKIRQEYKIPDQKLDFSEKNQQEWDKLIYNCQRLKDIQKYIDSIEDLRKIMNILNKDQQLNYLTQRIRYINTGGQKLMNEVETFIFFIDQLGLFAKYLFKNKKTISISSNNINSNKEIHITTMQKENDISLAIINNMGRQIKLITIAKNRKVNKEQLLQIYQSYEIDEEMMIQQNLNKLYDFTMEILVEKGFIIIIQKISFLEQIEQLNKYRQSLGKEQIDCFQLMEIMNFKLNSQ